LTGRPFSEGRFSFTRFNSLRQNILQDLLFLLAAISFILLYFLEYSVILVIHCWFCDRQANEPQQLSYPNYPFPPATIVAENMGGFSFKNGYPNGDALLVV
jgi:hypothetical protein